MTAPALSVTGLRAYYQTSHFGVEREVRAVDDIDFGQALLEQPVYARVRVERELGWISGGDHGQVTNKLQGIPQTLFAPDQQTLSFQ